MPLLDWKEWLIATIYLPGTSRKGLKPSCDWRNTLLISRPMSILRSLYEFVSDYLDLYSFWGSKKTNTSDSGNNLKKMVGSYRCLIKTVRARITISILYRFLLTSKNQAVKTTFVLTSYTRAKYYIYSIPVSKCLSRQDSEWKIRFMPTLFANYYYNACLNPTNQV